MKAGKNHRPTFLVVDPEHPGSISSRKLVLETAKFNVITCYTGVEAIATLNRFPNVDAVVLNAEVVDIPCSQVVERMKAAAPSVPIVLISAAGITSNCGPADYQLSSYEPQELLDYLRKRFE